MAPRTRRSLALQNSPEKDAATVGTNTPNDVTTSAPPKRGPGRPRKVAIPSESGSSAVSAMDSRSESGEYSTPATSNVATPVPSTAAKKSTAKVPVSQSTKKLQLPTIGKAQKSTRVGASKVASTTTTSTQTLDVSEFDSWDNTYGSKATRATCSKEKLEESRTLLLDPASPRRRSGRIAKHASKTKAELEDDDEEYMNDVIQGLGSVGVKDKGKAKAKDTGKAKAKSQAPSKRKMLPPSSDDADEMDWASPPKKRKAKSTVRTRGSKREPDSEDEPMAKSRGRGLGDNIDDSDDEMLSDSDDYDDDSNSNSDPYSGDSEDEDEEYTEDQDDDATGKGNGAAAGTRPKTTSRGGGAQRRPRHGQSVQLPGAGPVPVNERKKLEYYHPELKTMWKTLKDTPVLEAGRAAQPVAITQQLKPFQLEGLAWMKAMENTKWKGGLLGDEMGLGKTIQAVSLIMSDHPARNPTLVLVPPVALMQWTAEIDKYTRGALKTLVFHGTNLKARNMTAAELKKFDVLLMSYNTLESIYRKQEKGFRRQDGICKEKSAIHSLQYHRVILDEAHCIKTKTTMTAKATFALDAPYRWCLTGTPLQNRIGEFFSLVRFLNIEPFASYFCKDCACTKMDWAADEDGQCEYCDHHSMRHISVFNQELLNPIQREGNHGEGKEAFKKLRLLTERIMLRRLKKDHTNSMELPVKEIYVDSQFFGEAENDFANSIMSSGKRKFDTYVAQGVMLNNYANIFGLIMQMRQVADHPDLILKKSTEGGQNVLVCCICDEPAEEAIRSRCKHDFCRSCAKTFINSQEDQDGEVECPRCHIPLSIDLEQPEMEQDEAQVKKSSIINRIKMENWTSSSKIELLVHELHRLRKNNATHKSIIFSQFTTMLQLIEWRLRRAGITTVMLDGSMTPAQRQGSINHFMQNVDVECFLVSLKAGGVALNLTEASRVFIVDPWWNPAAEWQSADRCHRIGQTRPCIITRLCIEDSVESRMVLLQEKKTNMIHSTINSDDAAMESLTPEDLQFLFRGN